MKRPTISCLIDSQARDSFKNRKPLYYSCNGDYVPRSKTHRIPLNSPEGRAICSKYNVPPKQ